MPSIQNSIADEFGSEVTANLALNGDNAIGIRRLQGSFEAAIDLVFIDPPYNSGDKLRSYDDSLGSSDAWIEHLRLRLELTRPLMSERGVICIAVSDEGMPRLRLLMEEVFGRKNYIATLVHQGRVKNSARFSGAGVDYMVVFACDRRALADAGVQWRESKVGVGEIQRAASLAWESAQGKLDRANEAFREWWRYRERDFAPGLHEYCRLDERGRVFRIGYLGAQSGRGAGKYDLTDPLTGAVVASPPGDWVVTKDTMRRLIAEDRVLFHTDPSRVPSRKLFLDEMDTQAPLPTFTKGRDAGTMRLRDLLGEHRFDNPKDPQVLARWFRMMAGSDALVLDFYAGSGTTAEAVMMLNAEDGGNRRFILVNNNEVAPSVAKRFREQGFAPGDAEWERLGVFENVLKPRLESLITGLRPDGSRHSDGLNETVVYARVE